MKIPQLAVLIDRAWFDLARAAERCIETDRLLYKAITESTRCEREHRNCMRGYRAHHPRSLSVQSAARYFVLRWLYGDEPDDNARPTWFEAGSIRADILYSRALRGAFLHFREKMPAKPEWLDGVDYARDIARSAS